MHSNRTGELRLAARRRFLRPPAPRCDRLRRLRCEPLEPRTLLAVSPLAVDDAYSVPEDDPLQRDAAAGLLANDDLRGHAVVAAVVVDGPDHGVLALSADGAFDYTPDADFFGDDGFDYRIDAVDASTAVVSPSTTLTASDAAAGAEFGQAIAVAGDWLFVGAAADSQLASQAGAVYVFEQSGGVWSPSAKLTAPNAAADALFGAAVATDGQVLLVGAPGAGAAYAFELAGSVWEHRDTITSPGVADQFGQAVALDQNGTAVVGAPGDANAGADSGAAYVFLRDGDQWDQQARLLPGDPAAGNLFGAAVAIDTGRVAVGAPGHDGEGSEAGAIYLFGQDAAGWSQTSRLTAADTSAGDEFGRAMHLADDRLVVGAPGNGGTGAAYVFDNVALAWSEQQKLSGDDSAAGDRFGEALAVDGSVVAVAAPNAGAVDAGAVYLFQPNGAALVQQAKLSGTSPVAGDRYGSAIGIAGDWVVAGAPHDDDAADDAGSAAVTQVVWENTGHVAITVDPENDAPVALDDAYDAVQDGQLQVVASTPVNDPPVGFSLSDFSNVSTLTLNGDAITATDNVDGHPVLRLTESPGTNEAGSVFTTTPIHFAHDYSFSTSFSYRLSDPDGDSDGNGQGGEGFTFVIHDDPAGASLLGGSGGNMGLFSGGTQPGVALLFDTYVTFTDYDNVTLWDADAALERAWVGGRFNDGQVQYAWIDYDASTYALELRLSSTAVRPESPAMIKYLDLRDRFSTRDLYVGFTASTGGATNDHDIRHWDFTSDSTAPGVVDPVELVPAGAVWRFDDTGTNLGTAWRNPGFNDSGWDDGPAQLGYGDGDEATEIEFGGDPGDKHPTSYFRHTFQVQAAHEIDEAFVHLLRDDGAAVYLNGVEVARSNLDPGATYSTFTDGNALADGNVFHLYPVDGSLLVEGQNTLAVEVHQTSPTSSDVSFDLRLAARRVVGDGVLANDSDVDGDALTAAVAAGGHPAHGSLTLGSDGGFTYTPDPGYFGADTFTYEADDASAATPATVTIRVHPTGNLAPTTAADFYSVDEDDSLSIGAGAGVLANDSDAVDPIADTLEATLATAPAHGQVTLHVDGSFDYMPDADYSGPDQFTYVASDGYLDSSPTTVTIDVLPIPDAPVATDDQYTVLVDQTLTSSAATLGTLVADMIGDFSGTQGQNGWFYGYYDAEGDADGTYEAGDFAPYLASEWTGSRWRLSNRPPNTTVAQAWSLPNGTNRTGGEQWAMRRWQSDVEGTVAVDWRIAKYIYTGGNGVTGHVFLNGQPVDQTTIARDDLVGASRRIVLDVSVGDVIDFAHSPVGTDGDAIDNNDYSTMSAAIQLGDFAEQTLLPAGATWNYWGDGLNQGTQWREVGYDDGAWPSGAAPLGYDNDNEATVISYGPDPDNKFITYHFRHNFDLGATLSADVARLRVKAKFDDGIAVYLNGHELVRDRLVAGAQYDDLAGNSATDGQAFVWYDVDPSLLVDGTNLLAAEVHQSSPTSSDLTFDLELVAAIGPPGVLANDADADGDVLSAVATSTPDHGTLTFAADGTFQYIPDPGYAGPDQFTYTALSEPETLVDQGAASRTLIPTDGALGTTWTGGSEPFDDLLWTAGPTGVGYNGSQAGFTVTNHFASVAISSLTDAEIVIADPGLWLSTTSEIAPVIDYLQGFSTGHYAIDADFPGIAPGTDPDDFVIEATATVTIPTAGPWTFGVRSDDGFGLDVGSFHSEFPTGRGADDTLATFDFPAAGDYPLRLVMFDLIADGMVELFAAPGTHTVFDAGAFHLVGDVAGGGLAVTTTGDSIDVSLIGTDVGSAMQGANATAYVRIPLTVIDPADYDALVLDVQYDDGFVAYLNGVEIARRHAPAVPAWDSAAEGVTGGAMLHESIDVSDHLGALAAGANILAVHGLNASAGDDDFLALPRLLGYRGADSATVQITVNAAPQANNDSYQTPEDQTLVVNAAGGVLANDTDDSGVPLVAAVSAGPSHGQLTLAADGALSYVPDADFFGIDTFTYRAGDGHAWSNGATVTIDVLPRNDAPVAVDDFYQTVFNEPIVAGSGAGTGSQQVFFTDFNGGVPAEFSGYFAAEAVQGYDGLGNGGNTFSGTMLRNDDGPRTQVPTRLYLTDLPTHTSIDLNFLLAVIDSWNGSSGGGSPDYLGVFVDGVPVFIDTFDVFDLNDGYAGPPGSLLSADVDLGFNSSWVDAAFDMGPDAALSAIPHTAADVLIEWAAWGSYSSWTGGSDESWAIDNVEVVLNNVGGAQLSDTFVPIGADWKYLDDGSNQGAAWRDGGFDDASWAEGPAQLGYGDGDEATVVSFGGNDSDKFPTTYFRHTFNISDADAYDALYLRLVRDDGAAVYVNGTEVLRTDNLAPNASFDMYADYNGANAVGGIDEHRFEYFQLDPAVLVDGDNVVAVEIHQQEPDSSDISFDFSLSAARGTSIGVLANDIEVDGEQIGAFLSTEPGDGPDHGQLTFQGDGSFTYTPDTDYIGPDSFKYTAFAVTSLFTIGADAQLLIPTADIGSDWTGGAEPFDETGWTAVTTGVGFGEAPGSPPTPLLYAGGTDIQSSMLNQNSSAYLRVPFELEDPSAVDILALYMQYDDGFVAYLNGTQVEARNEPGALPYDATATTERTGADRLNFDELIIPVTPGLLHSGTNILAVHGLNFSAGDPDFVISPVMAFAQLSNTATVSIDVIYVNTPAVANPDLYSVDEDNLLTVDTPGALGDGVLANDTDVDDDPLSAVLVDDVDHGTLTLNSDGTFTYDPDPDYFGPDSFTYQADDGTDLSNVTTVSITVDPINDPPVAGDDLYVVDIGVLLSVGAAEGVLANDTDVDGPPMFAVLLAPPGVGVLDLQSDGSFTFDPQGTPASDVTFTYQATDTLANSDPTTVTLRIDTPPVAVDDPDYTVLEDQTLVIDAAAGVLDNDSDAELDLLAAVLVDDVQHGTLALADDGSFTYSPAAEYSGSDSFTYRADDGDQTSALATATITISEVNDPPVAVDDTYFIEQDGSLVVDAATGLLANDIDPDDPVLTVFQHGPVSDGTLVVNTDGSFTYDPSPGFVGSATFTYLAADSVQQSVPATVTIVVFDSAQQVRINEIMYHPASEDVAEEFIELKNLGTTPVNLFGWQLDRGVDFTFPEAIVPASGYLIVAADPTALLAKYPGATNVFGPWSGQLSNRGEEIRLVDGLGATIDKVEYADQGEWAVRRSFVDGYGVPGWEWLADHDGGGSSLELINPQLSNNHGQNWEASTTAEGTPGANNSVAAVDVPPMILDAQHTPIVPRAADTVTVTARLLDELDTGITASVFYRVSTLTPGAFIEVPMADDGDHGDGDEGDGVWGAVLPAQSNGEVVEFYVQASDHLGALRTWPAPTDDVGTQGANALYQVDETAPAGSLPTYRLIMTAEEADLLNGITGGDWRRQSNAQRNVTFVSVHGFETQARYSSGLRFRGASSRWDDPASFRLAIPHDRPWHDVTALNLNAQYTWLQLTGSAVFAAAGLPVHDATAVRIRLNGTDYTNAGQPQYGVYVALEVVDSDFANRVFPDDSGGNVYSKRRPDEEWAWYDGNVAAYEAGGWAKSTNSSENDWSDLDNFLWVMNNAAEPTYLEQIEPVANVDQWIRWFAVMTLINDRETNLSNGHDDDYMMYRGVTDPRFVLLAHDLDTIFGQGDTPTNPTDSIFPAVDSGFAGKDMPQLVPFFDNPVILDRYYRQLQELIETTFSAAELDPLLDNMLGGFVPQSTIDDMKTFADQRRTYVLSQIPTLATIPIATITGEPPAVTPLTATTLSVGGDDITHYRFKLNDGAFGAETPVGTPITLAGLSDGDYTVQVVGKTSADTWQAEADATVSSTWTVDTGYSLLRINEVLAANVAAVERAGLYPDVIELFNAGPTSIDISGMRLTDEPAIPNKYVFAPSSSLDAGAYLVLDANDLGFGLSADGEGVYLFDSVAAGSALLDQVEFGMQLDDLSIGRNAEFHWVLGTPTPNAANVSQALGSPQALVINEWLADADRLFRADRIELFNPDPLPVDLGRLYLTDHYSARPTRHQMVPLSFVAGGGYAVLVADDEPLDGADHLSFRLSPYGEMIALLDEQLEPIDLVIFGPQATDVSQGPSPDAADLWGTFSPPTFGQPNPFVSQVTQTLVPMVGSEPDDLWHYDDTGNDLGTAWREVGFDDALWPQGLALLYVESSALPAAKSTELRSDPDGSAVDGLITYYFRREFDLPAGANAIDVSALEINHIVDDGMVVYINGHEVYRFQMDGGEVDYLTQANDFVGNAEEIGPVAIPTIVGSTRVLVDGTNTIAVEVHQSSGTSSDVVFGMELVATIDDQGTQSSNVYDLLEYLQVTEINYNPPEGNSLEFIELQNTGPDPLELAGVQFSDGIDYTFGDVTLASGEFVVVAADPTAFAARYGVGTNVVGPFSGRLSNGGEELTLELPAPFNGHILDFAYNDGGAWPNRPDGNGSSLELIDPLAVPLLDAERTDFLENGDQWRSSVAYGGSPGAATVAPSPTVVVNEVLTRSNPPDVDIIELHNTTAAPINVGYWWLSDASPEFTKFQIPADTVIPAFGYVSFDESDFNPTPETPGANDFALDGVEGDDVWLLSGADGVAWPLDFVDHVEFGAARIGETFGRWPNGSGELYPMISLTRELFNSGPRIGPLVISEVMYHPVDPAVVGVTAGDMEFVEIFNPTSDAVELTGWRLDDGVTFDFAGVSIARGEALVVVAFDPVDPLNVVKLNTFRAAYGIDASVRLVGPFSGQLDNGGETVTLLRPGTPPPATPHIVPLVIEDRIVFDDETPWPTEPDGGGQSLHRAARDAFGGDATGFSGATPTPGNATLAVDPAVVSRLVFYDNSAFDGNVAGPSPLDDNAIATDKQALRVGQQATAANYTSFADGITGIMVDLSDATAGLLTLADFQFRVGNGDDTGVWSAAPPPTGFLVRAGEGVDGADRVTLTWTAGAIVDQWLEVTVGVSAATGLLADDRFYIGNAVGETGDSATNALVTAADVVAVRDHPRGPANRAGIDDRFDFDRNQRVDALDALLARNHASSPFSALRLILPTPPAPAPPAGEPAPMVSLRSTPTALPLDIGAAPSLTALRRDDGERHPPAMPGAQQRRAAEVLAPIERDELFGQRRFDRAAATADETTWNEVADAALAIDPLGWIIG